MEETAVTWTIQLMENTMKIWWTKKITFIVELR